MPERLSEVQLLILRMLAGGGFMVACTDGYRLFDRHGYYKTVSMQAVADLHRRLMIGQRDMVITEIGFAALREGC